MITEVKADIVDLVEVMSKLDTTTESKLIVNTGWILKKNKVIIDEILDAKKCFFIAGDEEYKIVPVTKKNPLEDSDSGKISFDVEFKINRKHDDSIL